MKSKQLIFYNKQNQKAKPESVGFVDCQAFPTKFRSVEDSDKKPFNWESSF